MNIIVLLLTINNAIVACKEPIKVSESQNGFYFSTSTSSLFQSKNKMMKNEILFKDSFSIILLSSLPQHKKMESIYIVTVIKGNCKCELVSEKVSNVDSNLVLSHYNLDVRKNEFAVIDSKRNLIELIKFNDVFLSDKLKLYFRKI